MGPSPGAPRTHLPPLQDAIQAAPARMADPGPGSAILQRISYALQSLSPDGPERHGTAASGVEVPKDLSVSHAVLLRMKGLPGCNHHASEQKQHQALLKGCLQQENQMQDRAIQRLERMIQGQDLLGQHTKDLTLAAMPASVTSPLLAIQSLIASLLLAIQTSDDRAATEFIGADPPPFQPSSLAAALTSLAASLLAFQPSSLGQTLDPVTRSPLDFQPSLLERVSDPVIRSPLAFHPSFLGATTHPVTDFLISFQPDSLASAQADQDTWSLTARKQASQPKQESSAAGSKRGASTAALEPSLSSVHHTGTGCDLGSQTAIPVLMKQDYGSSINEKSTSRVNACRLCKRKTPLSFSAEDRAPYTHPPKQSNSSRQVAAVHTCPQQNSGNSQMGNSDSLSLVSSGFRLRAVEKTSRDLALNEHSESGATVAPVGLQNSSRLGVPRSQWAKAMVSDTSKAARLTGLTPLKARGEVTTMKQHLRKSGANAGDVEISGSNRLTSSVVIDLALALSCDGAQEEGQGVPDLNSLSSAVPDLNMPCKADII